MGAAQHTPGPWNIDVDGDVCEVATGDAIASPQGFDGDEKSANIRLICAAPGLLEIARQHRDTIVYYIKLDEKSGDDEGSRLKRLTLARVEAIIASVEA